MNRLSSLIFANGIEVHYFLLRSCFCLRPQPRSIKPSTLIEFVRDGLLDNRAQPEHFRSLVPEQVPSGHALLVFEFEKKLP